MMALLKGQCAQTIHHMYTYTHEIMIHGTPWIMWTIVLIESCQKIVASEAYFKYKAKNDNTM